MPDNDDSCLTEKTEKTPVDEFMLTEYETIASAHFDLHGGLRQNFRFYLGLIAIPFTVFAVFKDASIQFLKLPTVLLLLFLVVPILGFLMFLAMINMRFDIILYTRAVNAVRDYFNMRATELGVSNFRSYLKLPTDKNKPPYFEGISRSYTWIFALIALLNSAYLGIFFGNLTSSGFMPVCLPWLIGVVFFLLHVASYWWFSSSRTKKEIPGITNGT
ncbi:MAG TPA: hypothetical protein VFA99_15375 [Acidobacteriaceae bacterium]|nr:hypothetical protein [Acidobacteriaceae bacterium]